MNPRDSNSQTSATSKNSSVPPAKPAISDAAIASQPRNFFVLAFYQVVMRMGWIFKTESIIMPAVLDTLGGSGWLRGCLPVINRFGQSIPPVLMARRIKVTRRKKWPLVICTAIMASMFLGLSAVWMLTGGPAVWWMPVVFLCFYAVFFASTGVNQMCFSTLQGKLVETTRRGRLLLLSSLFGALAAVTCAWLLLPLWLRPNDADFGLIFGFCGLCFAGSAVAAMLLHEEPDDYKQARRALHRFLGPAWSTIRDDANFRRLAIVAALFGTSMMLFPHYQKLGRGNTDLNLDKLIPWVIVQNLGTALFSLPAGSLADWRGNRLVIRLAMLGIFSAPIIAIGLAHAGEIGDAMFFLVFLFVGLTPVTFKTLNNYTLEICDPADHPRYLSTLNLCIALPVVLFSPLVGLLIDLVGFDVVFLTISGLVLLGFIYTVGLKEPRHHVHEEAITSPVSPLQ